MAFQISLTETSSVFNFDYPDGIKLNGPYEVCLKSFVTYNNIPNISESNNEITFVDKSKKQTNGLEEMYGSADQQYSIDNNTTSNDITFVGLEPRHTQELEHTLTIPKGTYEIQDIVKQIESFTSNNCILRLNKNTFKMEIKSLLHIDFRPANSIGRTLGFSPRLLPPNQFHESDLPVQIFTVHTIKVKCNLIKCNVDNLKRNDNTLYEFPLKVESGEKIVERPITLCYYPITRLDSIYQLHLRIVDQDDNLVDFRGEQIALTLGFQPSK